jgi:hypothetical protein
MSIKTASTSVTKQKEWNNTNPISYPTWTRNSNWLAMPTLADTEQQINLLLAVFDISGGNNVSFSCSGNYTVDWGDGTSNNYSASTTASHQYSFSNANLTTTSEVYKQAMIVITPQSGQNITVFNMTSKPAGFTANGMPMNYLDIQVVAPNMTTTGFTIVSGIAPTSSTTSYPLLEHANIQKVNANANIALGFCGCRNLYQVDFGSSVSLSSLSLFFSNCSNLITVNGLKVSSNCNGIQAFENCYNLVVAPSIGNFNNITQACSSMYTGCARLREFPKDWGNFSANVGGNFTNFFANCYELVTAPHISFPTGTSWGGSAMFSNCYNLKNVPLYNFIKCNSGANMFQNCYSLEELPTLDLSITVDNSAMFSGCYNLKKLPALNMPLVSTALNMFNNCSSLADMPIITTGTALTNTSSMFANCSSMLSTVSFNTVNVTNASSMFNGCRSLTSIPDNQYNLANNLNFSSMFASCISLINAPMLTTTAATTTATMFNGNSNMLSVPLYDLNGVTNTTSMFQNCSALKSIPAFDMSTATTLTNMFSGCNALQEIPAMTMNTSAVYTTIFNNSNAISRNRMSGINATVSMASQNLGATQLDEIYTNLSATGSGKTITVTGNWGTATDTPSIATAKSWTVTG